MTRWKLTVEYDGEPYCGWQSQVQEEQPTVQDAIELALFKFCQKKIRIQAAGRTDAGVHGRGQVAHFDLDYGDRPLDGYNLSKALNALMLANNDLVSIVDAHPVADDFHARFHAVNKFYLYRMINRSAPLTLEKGRAWHVRPPLDDVKMHEAAQLLVGTHDFTSYRASACQAKSPIKTLERFDVIRHGDEIRFELEGQSFLHHQVRNMVGTLMLVGEHKWSVADVKTALDARTRAAGGITAPPDGLYLMRIDY